MTAFPPGLVPTSMYVASSPIPSEALCKLEVPPLRGQLEVETFGRQWLVDHFARSSAVKSVNLLTFADGFGLYRSMHKSVMGKYYCIGSLERAEAVKQDNVILGPLSSH